MGWNRSWSRAGRTAPALGACVAGIAVLLLTYFLGGSGTFFVTLVICVALVGVGQALWGALGRCARSLLEAADMEQMVADQTSKDYLSGKRRSRRYALSTRSAQHD
jgi:hypothetical protein